MNKVDKFIKISLYFLLAWYLIAPFIWVDDSTLDFGLKLAYGIINYLIVIMLLRIINFEYKNPSFLDYAISFMMVIWFFYSTQRDYNETGYDLLLKMFYLSIDLLSTVFCIDSFVNFSLNSQFFMLSRSTIKDINNTLKIFIGLIFSFYYFNLYRHLR